MNQNSHLLQPFPRHQSSAQVAEQSLNWLCQGAVVVDQPWAGAWCAISRDTRQSRFPCWTAHMGTECSLPHKVHPSQIICLWVFPKSGSGPPSGVKNAPKLINLQPHIQTQNLMDSYKQSVKQHYFALIRSLLTLDSSEHMICLISFNREHCQFTKISLLRKVWCSLEAFWIPNLLDISQLVWLHCKQNSYLRSSKIERLALISNILSWDTKDTTGKLRHANQKPETPWIHQQRMQYLRKLF